jgi:nucleoside 2-deoxyribosyltransferase
MKIYLASPWFKNNERVMYTQVLQKLRSEGHEVYAPVEHEVPNAWDLSNAEWGRQVFFADIEAIDNSEEVWVLNFGMYPDTGTAWECGYAYAKGKTVRQLVYDFTPDKVFSLMMINGCEEYDSMCNYIFNRDDEIKIEQK